VFQQQQLTVAVANLLQKKRMQIGVCQSENRHSLDEHEAIQAAFGWWKFQPECTVHG